MSEPLRNPVRPLPSTGSDGRGCPAFEQALQEGLKALDAGQSIDDADVWAWVASWDTDSELPMPQPKASGPHRQ